MDPRNVWLLLAFVAVGCGSSPRQTTNADLAPAMPVAGTATAGTAATPLAAAGVGMMASPPVAGSSVAPPPPPVAGIGTAPAAGGGGVVAAGAGAGATAASAGAGAVAAAGSGGASADAGAGAAMAGAGSDAAGQGGAGGAAGMSAGGSGSTSATGTFPAVKDLAANGPYTAITVNNTGPSNGYTLYHPKELAPNGVLNPIVSWGNGGATTPVDYPMLPHLATHGFVVIASNNPLVTGDEVRAGIDWMIARNSDTSSPFNAKLDVDNISGVGYSAGGLATLSAADHKALLTIVIISGANTSDSSRTQNMPKLHTPIAYLCTADDASKGNCMNDYAVVKVPAFFGVMKGSVHTSVTAFLNLGDKVIMDRLAGATTAWLRWQQMQDVSLKPMFVGSDCGLCKDSNWTVEPQKNLN